MITIPIEPCAIFIDGIESKKQMLTVALGLDKTGSKHILHKPYRVLFLCNPHYYGTGQEMEWRG